VLRSRAIRLRSRCGVCRSFQQSREISGKSYDSRTLLVVKPRAIALSQLFEALLGLCERPQRLVPFGLKRVRNQSVTRVNVQAQTCQIRLIAGALDFL
jgi:hypothetical protein